LLAFLAVCSLAIGCGDKKENKSSESTSKADDKDDKKSKKDDKGSNKKPKATFDAAKRTSLTSEAKNSVGKIARGALMAYERESMGEGDAVVHALCKSATPVPEKVPSAGESYKPKSDAGVDFNAGDEKTGWPCLKFTSDAPINFQYSYTEGSTPKLAARGKDVAKGEAGFFELCAEADFEPGGKTTLICQTGQVNGDRVQLSTTLVELGEDE
jgi:type IV pilus assembly protein PilA